VPVMVFPVHIGANRPPDGHLAGPGRDPHDPPEWERPTDQLIKTDAATHLDTSGHGVDRADRVEAGGVDDDASGALRSIAIAPAQPSRDEVPSARVHRRALESRSGADLTSGPEEVAQRTVPLGPDNGARRGSGP